MNDVMQSTQDDTDVQSIHAYMREIRRQHNAKCRKRGFRGHAHQSAGHKMIRALERNGSLYGAVSIIQQTFNAIQKQKFKNAKENTNISATNNAVV